MVDLKSRPGRDRRSKLLGGLGSSDGCDKVNRQDCPFEADRGEDGLGFHRPATFLLPANGDASGDFGVDYVHIRVNNMLLTVGRDGGVKEWLAPQGFPELVGGGVAQHGC